MRVRHIEGLLSRRWGRGREVRWVVSCREGTAEVGTLARILPENNPLAVERNRSTRCSVHVRDHHTQEAQPRQEIPAVRLREKAARGLEADCLGDKAC